MALKLRTFDDIAHYRRGEQQELRWFQLQASLRDAIKTASMAVSPSGKRLHHQRRIPRAVLQAWTDALLARARKLGRARNFHELFELVNDVAHDLHGIGDLTAYDTALRIGAFLKLSPDRVYLHAGTRAGAKSLGLGRGEWLETWQLPSAFRRLPAGQVEDCLCLYESELARIARGASANASQRRTRRGCPRVVAPTCGL